VAGSNQPNQSTFMLAPHGPPCHMAFYLYMIPLRGPDDSTSLARPQSLTFLSGATSARMAFFWLVSVLCALRTDCRHQVQGHQTQG
jgi:hypothetical protein